MSNKFIGLVHYNREMQVKTQTAQFKEWAIRSRHPRSGDEHTSYLVAAFFKDMEKNYVPYVEQSETVNFHSPATWWEHLKESLPKWCRLDWVDPSLKFGWIQGMNTGHTQMVTHTKSVKYTTQITLRSYTVHVRDYKAGECIKRASFDDLQLTRPVWRDIKPD
jgi:hypothetical protein